MHRADFMPASSRPTRADLLAAADKLVPDLIAPNLKLLFVGINPGLYSAAVGHHFARPGNRFWPTLHAAGFTPRLLDPSEERELLKLGYGITNVVARASARADELSREELIAGGDLLRKKIRRIHPQAVAIVGAGAYRTAFNAPKAAIGSQPQPLEGATLWVLPNPSGLNANYQPAALKQIFSAVRKSLG
jgi:TDG/mug DNA glycosylase family protein